MAEHPLFASLSKRDISSFEEEAPDEEMNYPQFRIDEEIPFLSEWQFSPLYKNELCSERRCIIRFYQNSLYAGDELLIQFESSTSHSEIVIEARKAYLKKFNQGFRPLGASLDDNAEPMLAHRYKPGKTRLKFPVAVAPKLAGVRCLIRKIHNRPSLYRSRQNKEIPHLNKQFDLELNQLFPFLPGNVELDGQLLLSGKALKNSIQINSEMASNLICSLSDFATGEPLTYDQRYAILSRAFQRAQEMGFRFQRLNLNHVVLASNEDELILAKNEYQKVGYLGILIYKLSGDGIESSLYKSKRSNNLLKFE